MFSCSSALQVINGPRGKKIVDLQENVYPHGAGGLELFKYRADHGLSNEVDRGCFMYFCHAAVSHEIRWLPEDIRYRS